MNGWPTKVVSLVCHGVMESTGPHHLVIEVDDIELPINGGVLPEREHIDPILAFSKGFTEKDRVLVHCHMGMRRSTAAAIGMLVQHGMPIKEAFDHCYAIRPIMMPNRQILRLLDEALVQDGTLAKYGSEWVAERLKKDDEARAARRATRPHSVEEMMRILRLLD